MSTEAVREKWDRIYQQRLAAELEPTEVLLENAHLLPVAGEALDLACGLGGNALYLAQHGFSVTAWDISPVAIEALSKKALDLGLKIAAQALDVETQAFPQEAFDVVVVSRFLSRPLAQVIRNSLKPGGLLFYQTYIKDKLSPYGPSNPDYLLSENELIQLFKGMRVLVYREEGQAGDLNKGRRDEAYFVGYKR
jgi:2-polyprenyl-3-methyl-5-hydroxy-6-metoxy-1,4-benzoquinol methylase